MPPGPSLLDVDLVPFVMTPRLPLFVLQLCSERSYIEEELLIGPTPLSDDELAAADDKIELVDARVREL